MKRSKLNSKSNYETVKSKYCSQSNEQYTLQTQYEDLLAKQQKDLASAESEQSKISDTQSSLDSFLSSVVVTQQSSSGSSSGFYNY